MEIIDFLNSDAKNDYRPLPFWSWNDSLNAEKLREQIKWMNANNIGGFFMHARGGLKTEYLSKDWLNCVKECADEAAKLNMKAWLYDENGWPSGFAGGKLLENKDNCAKYIVCKRGDFDPKATVSYVICQDEIFKTNSARLGKEHINLYIETSNSNVDILNPEVVKKFLDLTHNTYKEHFGEKFAEKISGFFTDEPQYYRWNTAYSDMIAKYFKEKYEQDIFDKLALLFIEKEGFRDFRYRYWKGMQELMLNSYSKQVYEWCEQNKVKLTGHYIEETTLGYQVNCCGGIMPFYKYMHIPGIDLLHRFTNNELPAKQVESVACQFGKERILTESFACCGWDVKPSELKRIVESQFVNGVNLLCHHLIPFSEKGHRKYDYPAHFSETNPWISEKFNDFNVYVERLGKLIGEGKEKINTAVLQPVRSAYFYFNADDNNGFGVKEYDDVFAADIRHISNLGIKFHLIDETLMQTDGFINGNKIGCGMCEYEYLILPHVVTMDSVTEIFIKEYIKNGGKILILGEKPRYLEGLEHSYSYLISNCTIEDIVNSQPVSIGVRNTEIHYTYRTIEDIKYLFVQNSSMNNTYTQIFTLSDGINTFDSLDLLTLKRKQMPTQITLAPGESVLLLPCRDSDFLSKDVQRIPLVMENSKVEFKENKFIIDKISFSTDGINFSEEYPCSILFNKLLKEQYLGEIHFKYQFYVEKIPNKIVLQEERCNAQLHLFNGVEIFSSNGSNDECIDEFDISRYVQIGSNEYIVKRFWSQNDNIYNVLFGENVTESLKNCLSYDNELESIYISGDFGVYSKNGFTDAPDGIFTYADEFIIGETPQKISEPVYEGLPFFEGKLTFKQTLNLQNTNVCLTNSSTALLVYIKVNGNEVGYMMFSDELDISEYTKIGTNIIEVAVVISKRNLFGPHHYNDSFSRIGAVPDMFEFPKEILENGKLSYRPSYELKKLSMDRKEQK